MISADCQNTQSLLGRNATPLDVIAAAHQVLGQIDLDPSSDLVINEELKAKRTVQAIPGVSRHRQGGRYSGGRAVFWDCVVRGPMGILLGCKAADVELVDEQTEEDGEIAPIAS